MILFSSLPQMAVGRVQPPTQFVAGLFPGDKSTRHETYHLHPPSAKVMNAWNYTSTALYVLLAPTGTPLPFRYSFMCYVLIARANGIRLFVVILLAHTIRCLVSASTIVLAVVIIIIIIVVVIIINIIVVVIVLFCLETRLRPFFTILLFSRRLHLCLHFFCLFCISSLVWYPQWPFSDVFIL